MKLSITHTFFKLFETASVCDSGAVYRLIFAAFLNIYNMKAYCLFDIEK